MTIPVPLNPIGAAFHAIAVQGGFSTPHHECWRILADAYKRAKHGGFDDEWREGVVATLAWIDEQAGPDAAIVQLEFRRAYLPEDWREVLEAAL